MDKWHTWREVATIIEKMTPKEQQELARVDIDDGFMITEKAVRLIKDNFGVWTFRVGNEK